MRPRAVALACSAAAALAVRPAAADQPPDYDPTSDAWNGMSSFVGLAEGMGFRVTTLSTLEWETLSAEDVLVLIYPLQRVDPSHLAAFIQAGGNAVIADDFGDGKDAMQALGLLRAEAIAPRAARYEAGQPWAPIATGAPDHPIGRDVGDVVTNHPAALTQVIGATPVARFENGAVAVAGERGGGRFVAVSDPSIFINRMLRYPGNVTLTTNLLNWLDRGGRAKHVKLLRGDLPMYGAPRSFIDDPAAGALGRTVADLNFWLSERRAWLLTPAAMQALAAVLAIALVALALAALPIRRGPRIDGGWLRFARPARRDEPAALVAAADRGAASYLVLACLLRDHIQVLLAGATGRVDPLFTVPEAQLVAEVAAARGPAAGAALARIHRALRALPSRGHAAAPWGAGQLARREFDALYRNAAALCRTLGAALPGDPGDPGSAPPVTSASSPDRPSAAPGAAGRAGRRGARPSQAP